jgi:hypothetical protein
MESVDGLIFQEVGERKTKIQNELKALLEIWEASMAKASGERRFQTAETIEHLFLEADLLNPILQSKALRWAEKCGARHHKASVKSEARALQKVSRSYHGKWRSLCDLVRVAIDCKSLADLSELLKLICDDDDVVLLKVKNEVKNEQMRVKNGRALGLGLITEFDGAVSYMTRNPVGFVKVCMKQFTYSTNVSISGINYNVFEPFFITRMFHDAANCEGV